ncbi:Ribosomal protein S18 acetylase RimI [Evansella caseinilytica]|uniref:Ribosomal protein S18 acetylase RimI n=1 Tax=Evansella caseinilytica TaxID=1503961 RepID=A0A1H3U9F3_9BACI|nr:GNAT family N-acetyltransferase [Evansella caseinilytica]SDZ59046.1 Ribosomal protein S18 acetylase RimI [Evansella caseinilytica]
MEKAVQGIEVVHYRPKLAKAVADMWNKSRDGWGGHSDIRTEEQVLTQEENSTNIRTFVAMDGEEAVGYCGLSEYREDEGALYVPLLNVRTDCHGRKIGKKLLLTALEETIARGWPRLDLNTWPGNTKAVPLYKKCGFFWENRDDSVHLMNFLPSVLTTPLFAEFFGTVDWYSSNVREIKIEPDGNKQANFEVYEYQWKKADRFLNVVIEKTSRGICAFESEKYAVSMKVDDHKLVYGKEYPVRFHVENYTGSPISVAVKGSGHRNIRFSMDAEAMIDGSGCLEGAFFIEPDNEEQSSKKTHPSVTATLVINGEEITMKTGVLPLAPVKCRARLAGAISPLKEADTAYIELENHCPSAATLRFALPYAEGVDFQQQHWEVKLKEKERTTLAVPYVLQRGIFLDEFVTVQVEMENKETIVYEQRISFPFTTVGSMLYGECQDYYHLFSGRTHVALKKETNELKYERGRSAAGSEYSFLYPRLGKPFSEEFSIMKPEKSSFYQEEEKVGLKLTYPSRDFPGILLTRIIELSCEGLMSQQYVLENRRETAVSGIQLNHPLCFPLTNVYLPYDRQVVFSPGTCNHEVNVWQEKRMTENWIYSEKGATTAAIVWDKRVPIRFHQWHILYFEEAFAEIPPQTSVASQRVSFGQNVFSSVEEVREFAGQKEPLSIVAVDQLTFQSKAVSPFVEENAGTVSFQPYLKRNNELQLAVFHGAGVTDKPLAEKTLADSEALASWDVDVPVKTGEEPVVPVFLRGRLSSREVEKKALFFPVADGEVELKEETAAGQRSLTVSNGVISFKAASGFYPGLYSLSDGQTEWLDTSFPEAKPKGWWNPWVGGICFGLSKLIQRKMISLPSEGKFVTVTDQYGGRWSGIQLSTTVTDHQTYDGLVYHQFAVTRPGLPLLAVFTHIEQNTGWHFYGVEENVMINLSPGQKLGELSFVARGAEEQSAERYHHHQHETELYELKELLFERQQAETKLHFIPSTNVNNLGVYMTKDIVLANSERKLHTKAGTAEVTAPHFFVLTKEYHSLSDYAPLRTVRFTL